MDTYSLIDVIYYAALHTLFIMSLATLTHIMFTPKKYTKKWFWTSILLSTSHVFCLSSLELMVGLNIIDNPYKTYSSIRSHSALWFIMSTLMYVISSEILIWLQHYLLHTRFFYKHVHYIHHKFTYPCAFSFAATHPFEIILVYSSFHIQLFFFPVYLPVVAVYSALLGIVSMMVHGDGMNRISFMHKLFPLDLHNIHHKKHNGNYSAGILGLYLDRLFGTLCDEPENVTKIEIESERETVTDTEPEPEPKPEPKTGTEPDTVTVTE